MLESHLKQLDLCYFEVSEAFKGLSDDHVWVRPGTGLLSVGEIAGHIAYWEAVRFAGSLEDGSSPRDLLGCKIISPLLDPRFGYYTSTIDLTPSDDQLKLTAEQVSAELQRVHSEAMAFLKARNPDMQSKAPQWHSTYDELLRYVAFHIAYHTGQIYSARHFLGEQTPDN